MKVTFCGHRDVDDYEDVMNWLTATLRELIECGADTFYVGANGRFDGMVLTALTGMKAAGAEFETVVVLAYPDRAAGDGRCDYTIYPPLEGVPRRLAILKRNQWMVDASDAVVAYVEHDWGGAASTLSYAARRQKRILRYQSQWRQYRRA